MEAKPEQERTESVVYLAEIARAVWTLRRTTAFTVTTLIILALGIGASILIFSVINATMLQPLPYPKPEQLMVVTLYSPGNVAIRTVSADAISLLQQRTRSFAGVGAEANFGTGVNLSGAGRPETVEAYRISGSFFQTLGISPILGRSFTPEEQQPGGPHAVVLSHALWTRHFGKAPYALGKAIRVGGQLCTVVGIMPENFHSYPESDLWLPLQISPVSADHSNKYTVIARIKDGLTREDAQHELDFLQKDWLANPPMSRVDHMRVTLNALQSEMAHDVRPGLTLLSGAVLFVLLITCTNLAVLLTVRASSRTRETAIRLALGASRACVLRSFLIESLVLALLGGVAGTILAKEAIPFVLLLAPAGDSSLHSVVVDGRVLLFSVLVSLLTALAFGLPPALQMSRANLNELLRKASSNATSGSQHARMTSFLVSAQAALTILLLTGAGLLLRSFLELHSLRPGFESSRLWVVQLSLASERYWTASATARLLEQVCQKVQAEPGVEAASSITGLPLEQGLDLGLRSSDFPEKIVPVQYRMIGPEYFKTMGIRIIGGRPFSSSDTGQAAPVAIVNETLARQWWPPGSTLGHYVAVDRSAGSLFSDLPRQIVGVVSDVHESGLSAPPPPTVFVPPGQPPDSMVVIANRNFPTSIVIRMADGSSPEGYIRDLLNSVDPDLPLASTRPFSEVISASLARQRFYTYLIAGFGAFALVLTAVGLYALLSYQIVLRTREIGLRIAVGAPRGGVVGMIVRQGVRLVFLGAAAGMAIVPVETKLLASMLYNVRSAMPVAMVGAVVVLAAVAALASLLSSVRAASIEPAATLNSE